MQEMTYSLTEYILSLIYPFSSSSQNILSEEFVLIQQYIRWWGQQKETLSSYKSLILDSVVGPLYFQAGMLAKVTTSAFQNVKAWLINKTTTEETTQVPLQLITFLDIHSQLISLAAVYAQVIDDLFSSIVSPSTIINMQESCRMTIFACGFTPICQQFIATLLEDSGLLLHRMCEPLLAGLDSVVELSVSSPNEIEASNYSSIYKHTLQILFRCISSPSSTSDLTELLTNFQERIEEDILYPFIHTTVHSLLEDFIDIFALPVTRKNLISCVYLSSQQSELVLNMGNTFLRKVNEIKGLAEFPQIEISAENETTNGGLLIMKVIYQAIGQFTTFEKQKFGKLWAYYLFAMARKHKTLFVPEFEQHLKIPQVRNFVFELF